MNLIVNKAFTLGLIFHKDRIKDYRVSYNKSDRYKELSKIRYSKNKEVISEKNKKYRDNNKYILLEKKKLYYEQNKEEILKKRKEYYDNIITDEEVKTWQDMGYDHVKSFTGSMYDNSNPMPDWIATLERMFGLYNQTYTFYRMTTLEIMPVHTDHYRTYCRINNVSTDKVCRIVMMLEDWKPGHYFELDGIGYTNWKAGDYFMWKGDVPHAASNIGVEPRYTLQITGLSIYEGQLNQLFSTNIADIETNHSNPMVTLDILPKLKDTHNMVYLNNRYIKE